MRVAIARRPGYTRTCAQCATTWQVPRSARRWRSRLASRFLAGLAVITGGLVEADPAAMARTVDSISERSRQAEARHRCPEMPRCFNVITVSAGPARVSGYV